MKRVGIVSVVVMLGLALGGCGGGSEQQSGAKRPRPVNHAPVAAGASIQARDDGSYRITLHGSDPDGDALSYRILTPPSHGRLRGEAPVLRYLPEAGFTGEDRFTYSVSDGKLDSDPAEVTIRVKNRGDDNTGKGLRSLSLSVGTTSLNKDHNTTLSLTGTYADGSRKDLSAQARWIVTPQDAIKITGHTLTALKDVNVTLQARVGNILSNKVTLNIYWEVDGHRLPPEPDPKVNNATLLGVDVNHNGVRDDVERWIYERYPIRLHRALLISKAKFFQMVFITPLSDAKKLAEENTKNINCELYLGDIDDAIESDDWLENEEVLKNMIFNTKERVRKYLDYNLALSGGVYGSSPKDWNRDACSEEIRKVLEEMGK